jgi:hypothetical protein
MGYRELRLWARGIGSGWGDAGELQFYVRLGRDPNNFYLYRTELNGGTTRAAWLPEVRVDFQKLIALRSQIQDAFLRGGERNTCIGLDSLLIAASPLATGTAAPYAACSDGYVAFTTDPVASAPNLAAVQELSVGILRGPGFTGTRPITPGDTLELWVNDIRLAGVVDEAGYAGQLGVTVIASDFGDVRVSLMRRDPHFRQLAEHPTFLSSTGVDVSAGFRLEKLLPQSLALSIPLTINYTSAGDDPLYLSQSDIQADVVNGLRSPRTSAASYTLQVRRAEPIGGSLLEAVLDNLALTSTYTSARSRTEYQSGDASRFTLGMDFNVSRAFFPAASRWAPADLYFTSVFTHARDDRKAFLFPAGHVVDPARDVSGLTKTWRNGTVIALRPWNGIGGRLDFASVRDLRGYSPSLLGTGLADQGVGGLEAGAERERAVQSSFNFAPPVRGWVRPRLDFASTYNMVRDPNAPFATTGESHGPDLQVPRRLANTQSMTGGATFDLGAAVGSLPLGEIARGLAHALRPLDVTINRSVVSLYDATGVAPPLTYQLALGSAAAFRRIRGSPATAAAVNNQLAVTQELRLPLGASLIGRYHQITLRNWTRRFDQTHAVTDGAQVVFPDLALRWSGRPAGLAGVWSNLSLTARVLETEQEFGAPLEGVSGGPGDRGVLATRSYPVTASAVWEAIPGLTTNITIARTLRDEERPGLDTRARATELSLDVAKPFALPRSWDVRSPLRTRLTYHSGDGSNFVVNPLAADNLSRITENGRRAWTFTADTDVAENLASSFVISRVLSFDRNLNRRFTQTILSAVLHMQFFGGALR